MLRDILELAYFLSGPALVVVAAIGLRQISVSREVARTSAKRDAYRLTAEQCKHYCESVIPLLNQLDVAIREQDLQIFEKSTVEVEGDKIKILPFTTYEGHAEGMAKIAKEFTAAYNALNAFFISRLADERLAYSSLATTYCTSVRKLLPVIVPWAVDCEEDNILKLFLLWHNRKESAAAKKEMARLQSEIASKRTIRVPPIGT
jgi:hypothetical protein